MKTKKIVTAALACVLTFTMAFSVAACSPKDEGVTDDLKFDEFGDPIFDDVKLNVWSVVGAPDNDYLALVNTQFNDYYRQNGVQAEITSIETSLFYTQLANTINTDPKNAPDVILFHSERLTYLVENNLLVSLDDCYDSLKTTFDSSNYFENILSECYVGDSLYGLPLDVHSGIWYVREDILAKNGLTRPTNMSEFESVCQALMDKKAAGELWVRAMDNTKRQNKDEGWRLCSPEEDFYPVEMSGSDNIESGWLPQTAVIQNGGKLTNDEGEPAWNTSDGLKTVLEKFDSWQGAYIGENRDSNTLWSNLGSGMAVFGCEGPWWAESRLNEYDTYLGEGSLGVMGLSGLYATDVNSQDADKVYGVGHCFSVTRTVTSTSERAAGLLYAKYMTENAVKYMSGGHLPACKSVYDNPEYTSSDAYNRYLKYMGDPSDFVMLGNTPYYSEVYEKLKLTYIYTLSKNKTGTVESFINECYQKAMSDIAAKKDL